MNSKFEDFYTGSIMFAVGITILNFALIGSLFAYIQWIQVEIVRVLGDNHRLVGEYSVLIEDLYDLEQELENQNLLITENTAKFEIVKDTLDISTNELANIRFIAEAIKETLPENPHPKVCRRKPTPSTINRIAEAVYRLGNRYGVSHALILGIIRRESAFCQEARSRAGAIGLMQLMPETAINQAKEISAESGYKPKPWKLKDNVWLGIYYISKRLIDFEGNEDLALKAYNAGIHHVKKVLSGERTDYYIEPKKYSKVVLSFKQQYQEMGIE